jgi:hypothetical protein
MPGYVEEDDSTQITQEWDDSTQLTRKWDFYQFHKNISPEIQNFLRDFQEIAPHLEIKYDKVTKGNGGVHGTLVEYLGHFLQLMNNEPGIINNQIPLLVIGSALHGGIEVTYRMIHILLSGIIFF